MAVEVAGMLRNSEITDVHARTVQHTLHKSGIVARKKVKKTRVQGYHKKSQLVCKKDEEWTIEDWRWVIWSDEMKVNRLGSDGRKWVWMKKGKRGLADQEFEENVKIGGGNPVIWGCFIPNSFGYVTRIDGGLNAKLYVGILQDRLLHTLEYYGYEKDDIVFQQNNDPKHMPRWLRIGSMTMK